MSMKPFNKYKLNNIRVDIDPGDCQCDALYTVTSAICAKIEDLTQEAIVQEIIQTAQKEGISDLWILDKNFILDALREKAEREDPKPLTIEELRQMNGEPAWVAELKYFAIVEVLDSGMWAGVPFVHTSIDGVRYVWNAESRNLHCYRHKPKEVE